ncbi:MAG TPA: hypothetical protein VGI58_17730 [Streptosporangiaceae bacterium]|jgi:hypothetical protein
MSGAVQSERRERLERSYRLVLAWYPKSFRHENGEEILGVLLASAEEGQTRIGVAESAALIRGALRMRLRPGPGRLPWTVFVAVRLMCAGAVVQFTTLVTLLATSASIRMAAARGGTPTHSLTFTLVGEGILLGLAVAMWLWLAWANGRRRDPARFVSLAVFLLYTMGLVRDLSGHALAYAPVEMSVAIVAWAIGLVTIVLLFIPRSWPYYRQVPELARQ